MYKVGDIRNGYEVLPANKRKTVLLLSDDLRMTSGVGNMSREFVMGTIHRYNWVQIGGAIDHPDADKLYVGVPSFLNIIKSSIVEFSTLTSP